MSDAAGARRALLETPGVAEATPGVAEAVTRIVEAAPPLTDEQVVVLRAAGFPA